MARKCPCPILVLACLLAIRHPSTFRYTYMPDHLHLTERDLEDLYQYFRVKNRELRKVEPTRGRP